MGRMAQDLRRPKVQSPPEVGWGGSGKLEGIQTYRSKAGRGPAWGSELLGVQPLIGVVAMKDHSSSALLTLRVLGYCKSRG